VSGRHYGLDWLRIAAFALLIVYHVAMVFAPWDWVVKWPQTYPALIAPMALLTPWRLPLLFVVSGFATRRLLDRSPGLIAFVKGRSARLLTPLAFALAVLLPPELWVRVREHGDGETLVHYWLGPYWSLSPVHGFAFPHWEHLWFVVYLWAYTIVLTALVAAIGSTAVQTQFDRMAHGTRVVWIPAALLVSGKLALLFVVPERQGLTTDWGGHAEYFPLLLFGFTLGGSSALWDAIARNWRIGALLAALAAIVVVWVELAYRYHEMPPHLIMAADRAARIAMAWGVILALLRAADTLWNQDHPARATLAEAVFPAYLIHHPVLVVLAWEAPALGLGALQGFVFLLSGTIAACGLTYIIGRDVAWLRPLIGLSPMKRQRLRTA
jgi:glucans biosynthesis protein C